jgi:hypothetical protein
MTNKNILILTCGVSILVFAGCAASTVDSSAADNATYRQAMQAHDEKLCENISDPETLQKCFTNVADFKILIEAQQKGDPAICDKLQNLDKKNACRMQFLPPEK